MIRNAHTAPRVLIAGYYGKGNFGDDVLLTVTHGVVRRAMPDAEISVMVHGDMGAYVAAMLPDVHVIKPSRHGHFDVIVHGGGGVFFDFAQHGWRTRWIEHALRIFGFRNFLRAERLLRCMLGKPRISATHRMGLGIGVGGFSPGSPRLRHSLSILADFAALWVRDAASVTQLARFQSVLRAEVILGSDLAFLTEHWLPASPELKPVSARQRLGVVLRDWPAEYGGWDVEIISPVLAQLAQSYDITGFVFDARTDPNTTRLLAPYPTHIWHPETMKLQQFSLLLGTQDVLLTSRAHGAICGACLGVPSVIVALEPKLEQVHAMLPNATRIVDKNMPQHWEKMLQEACSIPREVVQRDVQQNCAVSVAALASVMEAIT